MYKENLFSTFLSAKNQYLDLGINVDQALATLKKISISLHCWQGDDVGGFEYGGSELNGGGIQATGNYPGKARNADELRSDLTKAFSLIPGNHRLNLHASYLENDGKKVDRNRIEPVHFSRWASWAKEHCSGIDFNPTFFSHPLANDGFTLSSTNKEVREFWIEHGIASRKIAANLGKELGSATVNNIWIPDGYKDTPIDRTAPRERLTESLDTIYKTNYSKENLLDSVESKLFGIGSESYVVGSHEFYLGYAIKNNKLLCLDAGHFHPTESIADKISATFLYLENILLHVSRGVRWDSDHVVTLSDDLYLITQEIIRGNYLNRTHIGLDYFDASINRVAAWVIGTRNILKALLAALLEPVEMLREYEVNKDYTRRLALLEEVKTLPLGIIWDQYCLQEEVPIGLSWLNEIDAYERKVLSKRN